jgi:hypothetical protein
MAVTLAPACLRLLGVQDGGTVQVVPHPSGKVIIAPMRMRVGVASELVAAAREVVTLRRQVARLRKRLLALPMRQVSRGFSVGFQKAYTGAMLGLDTRVDQLTEAVRRVEHLVKTGEPPPFTLPPGVVAVEIPPPDPDPSSR